MQQLLKDTDYPVGGATVEWYAWIKGLMANNQKIGVLSYKNARSFIGKPVDFDIVEAYGREEGIPKVRWFYKRYPALLKAVKEYDPDFIIQECASYFTGLLAFIGKKLNIPFVYRVANDMDTDDRLKDRISRLERLIYHYGLKHAKAIVCQNKYQYEQMKNKFPDKKLSIVHNPFYYGNEFPGIKKRDERKYVAWIGVFQHQKNLPVLSDIVRNLPDIEFRIAGKALRSLDEKSRLALNFLQRSKNVKFVGYLNRTEVIPFLSDAYALLNTSHYEGFSNTFLEAFFSGTPIVTTRKVDPDSIIENNGLGSIVESHSDLVDAINLIVDKEEKDYNTVSQHCREYILDYHNPKILAQKFIESLH